MFLNDTLKFTISIVAALVVSGCRTVQQNYQNVTIVNPRIGYDDSTLTNSQLPLLMPYNRIIDPAGLVIRYGDLDLENHTLDLKKIPKTQWLVVEDRYGIVVIDTEQQKILDRWAYKQVADFRGFTSTYSGIQVVPRGNKSHFFWSAANTSKKTSMVIEASWDGKKITQTNVYSFAPEGEAPLALPNEVAIRTEQGRDYLYVVLNGNNQFVKVDLESKQTVWKVPTGVAPYGLTVAKGKAYVSNWGGTIPTENTTQETAGVPYGKVYVDSSTGATSQGTVNVYELETGKILQEISVGLHPNDLITDTNEEFVYVANANSDNVSVIATDDFKVKETISVQLISGDMGFLGDTPNALAISKEGNTLYVANGLDNALAVITLGEKASKSGTGDSRIKGFIPTEAYPAGIALDEGHLYVSNLEGEGARVSSKEVAGDEKRNEKGAYNSHRQRATMSMIPLPTDDATLAMYTQRVKDQNLSFRAEIARLIPRKKIAPVPVPERIGEPSVFKHVLYIIKENRTYDQVFGDIATGKGDKSLCIFGQEVTPNQHKLARDFVLMDNYYVSGKCSAEGHQWTDAAMVSDYVEKNVRSWFRSYPHVQEDALVYHKNGFLWDNARKHGKTVRIYGEACQPHYDTKISWTDHYNNFLANKSFEFYNTTTISSVLPMLSPNFPGSDDMKIPDQIRASAFIKELEAYEKMEGDQLPELIMMALSVDHTVGTRPGFPTPEAMVADNDLALGRIVEALAKSKFWKNTVIFVTEDDSQAGWDHVSAYRTTGQVISPYSRLQKTVSTNYNQTSMVRTIEQILGLPPMNVIDATALPMFDCFTNESSDYQYLAEKNNVPLDKMNPKLSMLNGKAKHYAELSLRPEFDLIDSGQDDVMNRILWFATKGRQQYPKKFAGKAEDDDDDD
ncbi:MAG: bifunctional YncE family protein/alkaline phosphatase family protein [Spirosomataceae bacterium]